MKSILLEDISKVYAPASVAVDHVTLSVEPGEFFFLLGPSGCGKTTLLRIIAGLSVPTSGRVRLGGRDVTDEPVEDRNTALVFQNYALWPHMTVRENVEFGPKMRGSGRAERRRRSAENLSRVQMDALAARKPNQLSGGQQQRVALARALAAQPDCLLLDEPLSNLDARLRLHMRQELRTLVKSTGTTAVYVTHDQKEALSMADRIAVMDAGRVAQVGSPEELYDRPRTRFVADFLGEANFVEGSVAGADGTLACIETPVGVLRAAASACPPAAATVMCCIRPERIVLAAPQAGSRSASPDSSGGSVADRAPPDGGAEIHATVAAAVYLGEMRQYLCDVGGGRLWKVSVLAAGGPSPRPGQAVRLRIAPQAVCLLPD